MTELGKPWDFLKFFFYNLLNYWKYKMKIKRSKSINKKQKIENYAWKYDNNNNNNDDKNILRKKWGWSVSTSLNYFSTN